MYIEDLAHARPHMRKSARFSPTELRAYEEGYYYGVIYALRVAMNAIANYREQSQARRLASRRKESA